MALPKDHLAKFYKMTDAKEMWDAIKSRFGGNDESKKMQKYILKQQFEGFSVSNTEGLHKGYDRFQSLLSQLEIHGAGVSTEDANQKFLRSLPSAWSQVSLIMRTKPGVDSLSFDDLYNNLRVFESDIKGSTASSSSPQNVAFVSENTSSTNEVSTAYCVPNLSGQNSKYEQTSSYSLLANQSSCPQLDHEDLEQIDEHDLEEMDLKWQVAMISMRMKKFYKKTGRKLQFDAKEPVGFDKTKVECYNCHKIGHFARECRTKGTQDNRRRDAWNSGNKDGSRTGQKEDSKACSDSDTESVFMNKESEIENQPLYDRFVTAEGMHAVPPPMTGNYMPSGPDVEVDDSKFTYGPKHTQPSESESQTSKLDTCESNISAEPSELVSEPVVNESNVECQPKVWSDAPIIEEYESDSEDECVVIPTKQKVTPSFANQQVKTPRENVKSQFTHSQKSKVDKKDLGHGFTVRACFVCGSLNHLIRDCDFHEKRMARKAELNNGWNNVQRVNKQNQFVPSAVLTRTGTADCPHKALKNKGIVDSGCSRHMTGNKAYLAEFQDLNGGLVAFRGNRGYITGKGKIKTAPRAWYATLSTFLLKNGYRRGTIDKTLFLKKDKHDIILVQVYVDDIIFGSTKKSWCDEFEALMKSRFQMSSMGELTFFLGLQVKQKPDGIFISQDKYVAEILKKFDFANVKTASTPIETQKPLVKDEEASDVDVHLYRSMIGSLMYLTASRPDIMFAVCACSRFQVTPKSSHLSAVKRIFRYLKGKPKLGLWYPRVSSFDLESYSDSDYAGANLDRKSTTGGCQFLGRRLISWQCKKQTIVATSTTEAEYVAAASCCRQVLWIQNQMLDYGFNFMNTKIYIDNESTICIVKNPVYHSKTKHIAIRHHFIRDAYEKKLIQVLKIHTDDNVADLLTKAFDVSSTMAVLDFCPKHNMVAYLEKSEGNAEFHEIIIFLSASSIHHALTVPLEHQPNLSPRPSPTTNIPDSVPETSGENLGGHSSSDKSLSGNEGDMTLQSVYDLCLSLWDRFQSKPRKYQTTWKAQITKAQEESNPVINTIEPWRKVYH
ncbi:putative ribonuclease H-like domain-containing protein [Tanacetum coccineum]